MATLTLRKTLITKEETGRIFIGELLAAMNYHDPDYNNTVKLMRKKLLEIQRRESAAIGMIKKPPTVRKLIIKFGGSTTSLPVGPCKRPHSDHDQTLLSGTYSRNTLVTCKRQKIDMSSNGDHIHTQLIKDSTIENPNGNEPVNVMDFIKSIGGSEAEMVIEKRLTLSDVTENQGRLLIPELKVMNEGFLTGDEKIILGKKQDISVGVFDPKRRKLMLNLAKWSMSKGCYVLKTNWNQVVKTNKFKEGTVIRVLSFRVHQKLCFALDRVA